MLRPIVLHEQLKHIGGKMKQRKIGHGTVSAVGLGCMGMSEFYGPSDRAGDIALIHHALDTGVNFLDTADMYGVGHNEELIGEAVRDRRDDVFLATKFGVMRGEDGSFDGVNGSPEYIRQQAEGSLRRLGVDHIDLYYQHRVDPSVPIEESVGAMSRLVEEGKVRFLGLSEAAPATLRRAHAIHPIAALQTEYSLWTREPEEELLALCAELGTAFVPYSPLGRGFLTGKYRTVDDLADDDFRRFNPRFQGENFEKNLALMSRVEVLAGDKGVTPAQLALAWVMAMGDHVIPIPGTRKTHRLDENAAAADVVLSDDDMRALDQAMPVGVAEGTRYPEQFMATLNR
jgi:aryl-alcohol dehydrogenase-like predicted oxidoreductase